MNIPSVNNRLPQFNLEVASTPNCNMACTYCFEGDELKSKSKQTLENIESIIERMDDLLTDQNFFKAYSGICINFWGGEPTINFEWNKTLIKRVEEQDWSYLVTYFIYSNGYSFTKIRNHIELFTKEELENNKLRMQISWDGIEGGRIDHNGKQTLSTIEKNIKNIALLFPELHLRIKATIQPNELLVLKSIWLKFYELDKYIENKAPNSRLLVNYSPTLNYVDDYLITDKYIELITKEFIAVSRLELEYFKEHKRHLFSWFDSMEKEDFLNKRKTNCSAGINMMAIDIEGNASVCHGTLYSPLKPDFIAFHGININFTNTKDFRNKFDLTRKHLKSVHDTFDEECKKCVATVCYKCPVVNVEQSKLGLKVTKLREEGEPTTYLKTETIIKNFQNRDSRHCEIYKAFGPIDRALYKLKESYINDINDIKD